MAKKKKDKPASSREKQNFLGAAGRNMKYKDLKRKAVILGMPFPDACAAGVFDLIKYISNSTNKPDKSLIDQYDEWADKQLEAIGYDKRGKLNLSRKEVLAEKTAKKKKAIVQLTEDSADIEIFEGL